MNNCLPGVLALCSCVIVGCSSLAPTNPIHSVATASRPELVIGFLEDADRYSDLQFRTGQPSALPSLDYKSVVRRCFYKKNGSWFTSPRLTKDSAENDGAAETWFAIDAGRVLGSVVTRRKPDFLDPLDNTQELVSASFNPLVRENDPAFSSRSDENMRRPILLCNIARHTDPENWHSTKRKAPAASMLSVLNETRSISDRADMPTMALDVDDVLVGKTFRNRNGDWLSTLTIKESIPGLDNSWSNYSTFWFGRADGGKVNFLGTDIALIDAIDLDGDGKSEFLFWENSFLASGYHIFLHGFGASQNFTWGI